MQYERHAPSSRQRGQGPRAPKGGAWSMRPLRSLWQVGDALSQRKQQAVMREDEIRREDSLSRHVPM